MCSIGNQRLLLCGVLPFARHLNSLSRCARILLTSVFKSAPDPHEFGDTTTLLA